MNRFLAYQVYHCFVLASENFDRTGLEPNTELNCREVSRQELRELVSSPEYDIGAVFFDSLEPRSDVCYGAFLGPDLVAYAFFAREKTPLKTGVDFEFSRDSVYVYKVFTRPMARGKRAAPLVISHGLALFFKPDGPQKSVTLIDASNLASIATFKHMGFKIAQTIRVFGNHKNRIKTISYKQSP